MDIDVNIKCLWSDVAVTSFLQYFFFRSSIVRSNQSGIYKDNALACKAPIMADYAARLSL